MAKMNLDQLLDATDITGLAGGGHEKKAAAEPPGDAFLKLAQRCRAAAGQGSAAAERRLSVRDQQLVEKTAEVAVISRTLTEIEQILGGEEKTAAPTAVFDPPTAAFIKRALDEGHSPSAIAVFLKEANFIGRAFRAWNTDRKIAKGVGLSERGERLMDEGKRSAESLLREVQTLGHKGRDAQEAMVRRLRQKYGDERAAKMLADSGARLNHLDEVKGLLPKIDEANKAPPFISGSIGGKKVELSGDQLRAVGKPAALVGGGALAYRGLKGDDEGKKKKSGVVVINS